MSDSACEMCCQSETLLKELQSEFREGKYTHKKNKIKVARVDVAKKYNFIEKEYLRIETQPSVFIFYDGNFFMFEGARTVPEFLHWMNKIINPIVTLSTDDEIQKFLAFENEFEEKTKLFENNPVFLGDTYKNRKIKTRVIAFLFDKKDFNDELSNLRFAGKISAKRDELRIGMVTDKKLIKKYKANHGTLWFPEGSYSTIVLKRYDGKTFNHDPLQGEPALGFVYWINKKSIKEVEEMSTESFRVFELARQPIVVAFVDMKNKDKKIA
jgi:hypothetical protein